MSDFQSQTKSGRQLIGNSQSRHPTEEPVSRETVRKELGTCSAIWNQWGVPQRMVRVPPPRSNLTFPKGR
jgi:hypothetical protein